MANGNDNTVTPITTATNTPGTAISVGQTRRRLSSRPTARRFVANNFDQTVTPIDTTTNTPGSPISVAHGQSGGAMAISPDVAPTAVLSVAPATPGSPTQFWAAGSASPSNPIVSYHWDFGDGNNVADHDPDDEPHAYPSANAYTATVTETDTAGTSTSQVFTGQTLSRSGNAWAVGAGAGADRELHGHADVPGDGDGAHLTDDGQSVDRGHGEADGGEGDCPRRRSAPASLVCPKMDPAVAPVARMTDTGFAATVRLTVTATLHNTIRANRHFVCFHSTVPFRNVSSPSVKKAGTALLLNSASVANVAPCVQSSMQVGTSVVVTFVVPGGDPNFHIVTNTASQNGLRRHTRWQAGQAVLGPAPHGERHLADHVEGRRGKLPKGLKLSASTGLISGTPTGRRPRRSSCRPQLQKPAETDRRNVTIIVTWPAAPGESSRLRSGTTLWVRPTRPTTRTTWSRRGASGDRCGSRSDGHDIVEARARGTARRALLPHARGAGTSRRPRRVGRRIPGQAAGLECVLRRLRSDRGLAGRAVLARVERGVSGCGDPVVGPRPGLVVEERVEHDLPGLATYSRPTRPTTVGLEWVAG